MWVSVGLGSLWGLWGETVSLPVSFAPSLTCGPRSPQSQQELVEPFPQVITLMFALLPASAPFNDPCDCIAPIQTQAIQVISLFQGQLMSKLNAVCNLHSPLPVM